MKRTIEEEVKRTIEVEKKQRLHPNLERIEDLTKRLEKYGYNSNPGYSLPQIDTIGRNVPQAFIDF